MRLHFSHSDGYGLANVANGMAELGVLGEDETICKFSKEREDKIPYFQARGICGERNSSLQKGLLGEGVVQREATSPELTRTA